MKRIAVTLLSVALLAGLPAAGADDAISFVRGADGVQINIDGKPFASYIFKDPVIKRPYLAHVRAPNGVQVTRNHPPVSGQDATDHDTMHPGIWLAFGDISGADFWRNRATVEHVKFTEEPVARGDGGTFAVENRYVADGQTLATEACRVTIRVRPAGYLVIWDSRFSGSVEFAFGDQEEMGLGVRLATPLAVKNGGKLTNAEGLVNEEQVWGKQSAWCDYSGTIDGAPLGVLLVPDSDNFRPSWFHARDYGFVAANPFGRRAFTKGEPSRVTVGEGDQLRLRFAVLIHAGPIDLQAGYRDALAALEASR